MKKYLALFIVVSLAVYACKTDDVEPQGNPENVVLSSSSLSLIEADGEVILTATVGVEATQEITVNLGYTGVAGFGLDYSASTSITIPQGALSGSITISAIQDTLEEGNESIIIEIQSVDGAMEEGDQMIELILEDDDVAAPFNMIINEILYDPSNDGLDGDANGDGAYAQNEDEFIEFVNLSSQSIDLSGYKIFDRENVAINTPNHLIPNGTIIPPGKAFVVFGGGTPTGSFGGATVQTSTSGDLNLNNAGDEMLFVSAAGDTLLRFDIEPLSNNPNESYTRNPDLTGEFEQHGDNTLILFSPGTKIDGSPF